MIVGIHQPQYLPWLGLLDRVSRCDVFVILDSVPYSKNYFYNRNMIKTANGAIWLTVPILTKGHSGQDFTETRIDNNQNWSERHQKSIYYAYKNAPCFGEYYGYLKTKLSERWEVITDLCIETFLYLLNSFNIKTKIMRSSEMDSEGKKEELLINICKDLGATYYLSGPDGKNYLNLEMWRKNDTKVDFQNYIHPVYPQLYGDFVPNLSAIDLLFNCGREGFKILTSGQPEYFGGLR